MKLDPVSLVAAGLLLLMALGIVALFSGLSPEQRMVATMATPDASGSLGSARSLPASASSGLVASVQPVVDPVRGASPATAFAVPGLSPSSTEMPASQADTLKPFMNPKARLAEGHWKGLEALPLSVELKKKLRLPMELEGLLVDEVTLNAAAAGLLAGDVILAVNSQRIRTLEELKSATLRIQLAKSATITVYRAGKVQNFLLVAKNSLGQAQVETAPMILPGEIMPHPYRGPCTQCHAIGTTGHIVPDPDGIVLPPPAIRAGTPAPHKDRGPCQACHQIIQ
ncbi:magnetosome magnetite formation protein MamP [Candidatus Magnetaquicoccus inordinatus]|uniref:magnetosome magnetite formation protein MamP n=1 Tax=Candidatus Magnetaquicoccus inordinatus TaxID=2496818 RepID=UPI00102C4D28|nr:magnetosome magnetite formation protein MamP [Candidatus Magnetaquicoccus inordinatus]